MIACNILKYFDPMIGVEPHNTIVPPSPAPFPSPYFHPSFLGHGIIASKSKYSGSPETMAKGPVTTLGIQPMLQATDCGYMDVHLGILANVLLPITISFSSSKSMFVSGTTQINGSNVATAALVFMNLNLNCAFPVSLPTGMVVAVNTVQAGMSIGDYVAGVVSAVVQMAIDFAVGKALAGVSNLPLSRTCSTTISQASSRMFIRSVAPNIHVATPFARMLGAYTGTSPVVGSLIGQEMIGEVLGGARGIALDQTPAEDTVNSATTNWIGSGTDDVF